MKISYALPEKVLTNEDFKMLDSPLRRGDNKLYKKIRHIGGVTIGSNVDIGANTCIDRGVLEDTFIGDNTKIDNLVQIAHNVKIGKNCAVTAMSIICGSASIGNNCWLSPGSIICNNVVLPDETQLGINSVAYRSVKDTNRCLVGDPARAMFEYHLVNSKP